jgi:uncharacterized protein YcfL
MKNITLTLISFLLVLSAMAQPNPRKVQVAILFDTSNSMDGLIDQAKSRIWNIVNEVSGLTYNGQTPTIEFALYHYGNDGLSATTNYIEQLLDLTSDLDVVSQKLFALKTNGGSEFCGAVIGRSLTDLNWSVSPNDLKMIYIAGNEPFNQGPVNYKDECLKATGRNIFINTIYCGNYDQGVREFWKDGAECSKGDYFNIDSDKAIAHIDTPYDVQINQYNDSINTTYYGYGALGGSKKAMQATEDANAEMESISVKAERSIVKSKGSVYKNESWDLLDAVESGKDISEIREEELPQEFQGKTTEEKQKLIEEKKEDRERYQKEIARLASERQKYIDDEMKKRAEQGEEIDDFGTSVNESIISKAKEIGYEK